MHVEDKRLKKSQLGCCLSQIFLLFECILIYTFLCYCTILDRCNWWPSMWVVKKWFLIQVLPSQVMREFHSLELVITFRKSEMWPPSNIFKWKLRPKLAAFILNQCIQLNHSDNSMNQVPTQQKMHRALMQPANPSCWSPKACSHILALHKSSVTLGGSVKISIAT